MLAHFNGSLGMGNRLLCEAVHYCTGSNKTKVHVCYMYVYGIAGCPLLRVFECIEDYEDMI